MVRIGVLALQGDYREHLATLHDLGVDAVPVRTQSEIAAIDGLVIPGGESTVLSKLAKTFGVFDQLKQAISGGLPTFGTCAGLIMLASEILDSASGQESFAGLDVSVRRNAFGHQTDSFETDLPFAGINGLVHAAFIRAPIVERVGAGVEVLASLDNGAVVAVRQGNVIGTSFHPEITGESRIHELFMSVVESATSDSAR